MKKFLFIISTVFIMIACTNTNDNSYICNCDKCNCEIEETIDTAVIDSVAIVTENDSIVNE